MFAAAGVGLLVAMAMAMARAILGPTIFDRVLAVNTIGTKTVLLLMVIGFITDRPDWVDLSLVYALINFIGTIAVLKFVEFGDLGRQRHPVEGGD